MNDFESEETSLAILEQDKYDLTLLTQAENLTLFLIPHHLKISGGIMSIFSLCDNFRTQDPDRVYLITTLPGKHTYAKNTYFDNEENIYRFEQIIKYGFNVKDICIHIPEIYLPLFYRNIDSSMTNFLKNKNLQINILNQNIELMPKPYFVQKLSSLTQNITQTVAHKRYCTQEICNKWAIPTHWLFYRKKLNPVYVAPYNEREKIIVVSPDETPYREQILRKITQELPEFKIFVVENIPFEEYRKITAKAFFSITFGEGMDGYFCTPYSLGGIGFAVYNNTFFPDSSWLELETVFASYEEMERSLVEKMQELCINPERYKLIYNITQKKMSSAYNSNIHTTNIQNFLTKKYHFYPTV